MTETARRLAYARDGGTPSVLAAGLLGVWRVVMFMLVRFMALAVTTTTEVEVEAEAAVEFAGGRTGRPVPTVVSTVTGTVVRDVKVAVTVVVELVVVVVEMVVLGCSENVVSLPSRARTGSGVPELVTIDDAA